MWIRRWANWVGERKLTCIKWGRVLEGSGVSSAGWSWYWPALRMSVSIPMEGLSRRAVRTACSMIAGSGSDMSNGTMDICNSSER